MRTFFPIVALITLSASVPLLHEWVLDRQHRQRIAEESQIQSLRQQLDDARASLALLSQVCERAPEQASRISELQQTLSGVGTRLASFDSRVDASIKALSELHKETTSIEAKTGERAKKEAARAVEAVQADVKVRLESVEGRIREDLKRLETIQSQTKVSRDIESMRADMLAPIVQLTGDDTVGSGVLLYSQKEPDGKPLTVVVSSYHVVRNILAESGASKERGIRLNFYASGATVPELADMVAHDEDTDLVLLKVRGGSIYPTAARMLPAANIGRVSVFTSIYAVGCPLGNDPIPTGGEVASLRNQVNNNNYWMINAPTYFGNSGGGVFLAETRELVGVFSKIYTHGSGRPTVIPHMGLATPIDVVTKFLEKNGYGFIVQKPQPGATAVEAGTSSRSAK